MNHYISCENLHLSKQGNVILKDISLTIGKHDFITIVGPNGAGKSMLLMCLLGLIKADRGAIHRMPGLSVGYVPQRFVPDSTIPITVKRFLRLRQHAPLGEIQLVAKQTQIEDILDKPLHVLSGGQLQRVLLARSLLHNPHLLVLDEPAQNLDVTGQLAFYRLLEHIHKERHISIIMVSHDLHLVMSCTKQVICLYHHICCSGEPQMVAKDPEFISLFGSEMAQMMAVYNHHHNHSHVSNGEHTHADNA